MLNKELCCIKKMNLHLGLCPNAEGFYENKKDTAQKNSKDTAIYMWEKKKKKHDIYSAEQSFHQGGLKVL